MSYREVVFDCKEDPDDIDGDEDNGEADQPDGLGLLLLLTHYHEMIPKNMQFNRNKKK